MKRATTIFLAFATLLLAWIPPSVHGEDKPPPGLAMENSPLWNGMRVSLEVLVDGKPMRTIWHQGKMYLPVSRLGTEYHIRVMNHGPNRIVAIVSVDGLSVINGQPASGNLTGYVVAARSDIVIKGWRRNLESVAAFSFEERENSYAARVGRPDNIGVIGLVAIEELVPRPLRIERVSPGASADMKSKAPLGGTGTGYGREIDSRAYYVPFERSSNTRTITLYYDTVDNLRKAGIPVDRPYPNPFPGDSDFVPPPPGHRDK